ncbi:MAG TPA: zinc finger domain-containing protein, partial [Pyrinomonadaceae bacterium]|nr:zinc finger domain-containing protein [Pyrinomonadaceae bacterium]
SAEVTNPRAASVHLGTFPEVNEQADTSLLSEWERLFEIREDVLRALEESRTAKLIGSSLEARVEISAAGNAYELLNLHKAQLRYLFIVSQVDVLPSDEGASGVVIKVRPAAGEKCERCWNYSTHVGASERYPTVCERCVAALEEIERQGA